jgi:hypothetical protein
MSWSVSISTGGLSPQQKDEAFDMLSRISSAHQDAMALYYMEQEEQERKEKEKQKKKKEEERIRKLCYEMREKALIEEREREERVRQYNRSVNWSKRNKRT